MSEEDTHRTEESEARGAELRENIALTDARRAEEEVAKAHAEKEAAAKREEKLSRKERRAREKAERLHAEAERMRAQADATTTTQTEHTTSTTSAGDGAAAPPFPGAEKLPAAAQRPEVMVGAAFAGSFILARILKRLFD
jgi:chromosome segregation ATPase